MLLIVGEAKFVAPGTRYDNRGYEAHLHQLVTELGLNGEVRFLGQRGPDEVPEIMSAMDLLLMPSWVEPFGKVMVEAMAVGTPVLATNAGWAGRGHPGRRGWPAAYRARSGAVG